jgi:hypothetical protein
MCVDETLFWRMISMHLLPALSSSAPAVGDHFENLVLLGCGLLMLFLALALCRSLFDKLSQALSASAGWVERRGAARGRRRRDTRLKKYYPPARASHLRVVPPPVDDSSLARNALRRHAAVASDRPRAVDQSGLRLTVG